MIVTEEEAKTKWCPESRVADSAEDLAPSSNRIYNGEGKVDIDCRCIASACMAWRWYRPPPDLSDTEIGYNATYSKPNGYCGKAGKP